MSTSHIVKTCCYCFKWTLEFSLRDKHKYHSSDVNPLQYLLTNNLFLVKCNKITQCNKALLPTTVQSSLTTPSKKHKQSY